MTQSGLTVVGVENLAFRMEDTSTEVKDGVLCACTSGQGMLAERHWGKSSDEAWEGVRKA
jgi:hypothetical protein